ncbi:MAG: cysteine desulfurase [bacterium]
MFKPEEVKRDFPILKRKVNGRALVYLDSGATSQKPEQVLEAERVYYEKHNANVHRGAHTLGDEATHLLDISREKVAGFIGGAKKEVVFVRNTTEAINLVAYAWGGENIKKGDVIVGSIMEHHANLVPWQELCKRTGAILELVGLTKKGLLDQEDYKEKLKLQPKLVAICQVSNAIGTINPVKEMIKLAHRGGAVVLVDGAQAVPHMKVDVRELGADFYVFSGHKMLGPMGIGVLWGKKEILERMPPFLTGGGMINEVGSSSATWADVPEKFEAGTPNVAGAVGLMSAIDYLEKLGMENVRVHDREMVDEAIKQLEQLNEVRILGTKDSSKRMGSVSFEYKGVHAHDVATVIDSQGVAVRSGHHCTMPLHKSLGVVASVRASFNVYTTKQDINRLVEALREVKRVFKE